MKRDYSFIKVGSKVLYSPERFNQADSSDIMNFEQNVTVDEIHLTDGVLCGISMIDVTMSNGAKSIVYACECSEFDAEVEDAGLSEVLSSEAKFYTVNVPGKHGYSFVVKTVEEDEDAIAELSLHLFEDEEDYDYAIIEEVTEVEAHNFNGYYDIDGADEFIEFER